MKNSNNINLKTNNMKTTQYLFITKDMDDNHSELFITYTDNNDTEAIDHAKTSLMGEDGTEAYLENYEIHAIYKIDLATLKTIAICECPKTLANPINWTIQ